MWPVLHRGGGGETGNPHLLPTPKDANFWALAPNR